MSVGAYWLQQHHESPLCEANAPPGPQSQGEGFAAECPGFPQAQFPLVCRLVSILLASMGRRFSMSDIRKGEVTPEDGATEVNRRRLLRLGGAAAAGAVVAAVASANTAEAAAGTMVYGTAMSAGDSETMLYSSHPYRTMYLENSAGARALFAASSGPGDAPAVTAQVAGSTNSGPALYAENYGTGMGVFAHAFNGAPGVRGISSSFAGVMGDDGGVGTGSGVTAQIFNAANTSSALVAVTAGSGAAVTATGARALDVQGSISLNRSGIATVTYPSRSVTVTIPGSSLTAASMVFANLQAQTDGQHVESAVPKPGTNTAVITLAKVPGTAKKPGSTTVAWFVVG